MFGIAPGHPSRSRIVQGVVESAASLASRFRPSGFLGGHEAEPLPPLSRLEAPATRGRMVAPASVRAPSSRFPLLHRPSSIAILDGDPQFLQALSSVLPWEWHVECFREVSAFLNHLQQEPPRRERDFWLQQEIVAAWRADPTGRPLVPQILDYWRAQPERFALTSLCICDFLLPGVNGLEALSELGDWAGARVLLTGSDDAVLATEAFNRRLIDRFIPKSTLSLQVLTETVLSLTRRTDERSQQIWSPTFTQEQAELLRAEGVAEDLRAFAERTWLEWICIGAPFGILGLDFWGAVSWLQLQPVSGAEAAADLAAHHGGAAGAVAAVRAGRSLTDAELTRALGQPGENQAFLPAFAVGREARLLAGFRAVPQPGGARAMPSYRDWLRRQKVRQGKL